MQSVKDLVEEVFSFRESGFGLEPSKPVDCS